MPSPYLMMFSSDNIHSAPLWGSVLNIKIYFMISQLGTLKCLQSALTFFFPLHGKPLGFYTLNKKIEKLGSQHGASLCKCILGHIILT